MNRLTCTIAGVDLDLTAPFVLQLMAFLKSSDTNYRKYIKSLAARHPRPIKYIVDVGACIGGQSITYALTFPDAKILAIEPSKWNIKHLEHNTKPFPNIKRIKCVAADVVGLIGIAAPSEAQRPNMDNTVNTGLISMWGASPNFKENVPARLLDDLVTARVDWLKIDVEGAEEEVLRGASKILSEHRPIVQMEVRPENQAMAGRPAAAPHTIITKYDYVLAGGLDADWIYFPYGYSES